MTQLLTLQRRSPTTPKHGPLSGMLLPALTGAIVLPLALVSPAFRAHFGAPLSPALQGIFFASIVLMVLHKVESYWAGEFDQCPVYRSQGETDWAQNPRQAVFLGFVPVFLGMLLMAFLAFLGPPWHLVLLTIWLGQGLHEVHHAAKSLARGRAYPGIVTSVLFVGVMTLGLFPLWHDSVIGARGLLYYGYYATLPLVFLGFLAEDRRWIARTPASVWNPRPRAPGQTNRYAAS